MWPCVTEHLLHYIKLLLLEEKLVCVFVLLLKLISIWQCKSESIRIIWSGCCNSMKLNHSSVVTFSAKLRGVFVMLSREHSKNSKFIRVSLISVGSPVVFLWATCPSDLPVCRSIRFHLTSASPSPAAYQHSFLGCFFGD